MQSDVSVTRETKAEELKGMLNDIELGVLTEGITLSQLIREGSQVTKMAHGWGHEGSACSLSAAAIAAKARGLV